MASRFKIRKRLNSTKLKAFEKAGWVAGNSNALMEKIGQFLDIGATTGIAFLPKTNITGAGFAGCTATSKFCRTLRNKCKEAVGLLGCK